MGITDEMVSRALVGFGTFPWGTIDPPSQMRAALTAALSAPVRATGGEAGNAELIEELRSRAIGRIKRGNTSLAETFTRAADAIESSETQLADARAAYAVAVAFPEYAEPELLQLGSVLAREN